MNDYIVCVYVSLSLSLISLFLEFLCTDQMGRNRLVHGLHGLDRDGMGWDGGGLFLAYKSLDVCV
jgi:hypothetical protein